MHRIPAPKASVSERPGELFNSWADFNRRLQLYIDATVRRELHLAHSFGTDSLLNVFHKSDRALLATCWDQISTHALVGPTPWQRSSKLKCSLSTTQARRKIMDGTAQQQLRTRAPRQNQGACERAHTSKPGLDGDPSPAQY